MFMMDDMVKKGNYKALLLAMGHVSHDYGTQRKWTQMLWEKLKKFFFYSLTFVHDEVPIFFFLIYP